MEEQLLKLFCSPYFMEEESGNDVTLADEGRRRYGESWGGSIPKTTTGLSFPLVSLFLGRLRNKGFVQRYDCSET